MKKREGEERCGRRKKRRKENNVRFIY